MIPHSTPLIAMIVAGLGLAFIIGAIANRMRLSPLVGYLIAGVVIGPFTPGFVADQALALELAEIGVILLMFGVGLHFSLKDLLSVRAIALPGAIGQIAIATLLGMGLAYLLGWPVGAGLVFGLALSVASTVVLLRALQERRLIDSERGRIAVGWLIVEDLAMVLTLVLLPTFAGALGGVSPKIDPGPLASFFNAGSMSGLIAMTAAKIGAFMLTMLVVGRRVIPWVLHYVAHTGSRELFRLAVLAIALGIAYGSAILFGVSFALGAFFAGMMLAESELSHRAAQETLPLRDAFAVLFFVSVGMLFDPTVITRAPLAVLATLSIIVIGKTVAALLIVLAFRHPLKTALTISVSLAQIGEFSFILAGLGVSLKLLPEAGRDLILAGAILSILFNPVLFFALDRLGPRLQRRDAKPDGETADAEPEPEALPEPTSLTGHAVLVGYGRVGRRVAARLKEAGVPIFVIDENEARIAALKAEGVEALAGNASQPGILAVANLPAARWFVSAVPHAFEAGTMVEIARKLNPDLDIIARAHADAEVEYMQKLGATLVVMGESEIARGMAEHILETADRAAPPAPETPETETTETEAPKPEADPADDAEKAKASAPPEDGRAA